MKRLTAYVSGLMDAYIFRSRLDISAMGLHLKGCADTLDDGRVVIIAEGEEENLRKFAKELETEGSYINAPIVKLEYSDAIGGLNDFDSGNDWKSAAQGILEILAYKPDLFEQLISDLRESVERSKGKR